MDKPPNKRETETDNSPRSDPPGKSCRASAYTFALVGKHVGACVSQLTIDLFGRPFVVDWQRPDHREFANRQSRTCYELVSFEGLKSEDDNALQQGLPTKITTCEFTPASRDRYAGIGPFDEYLLEYSEDSTLAANRVRAARAIEALFPKPQNSESTPVTIGLLNPPFECPDPPPLPRQAFEATFKNGDVLYFRDVARHPLPDAAKLQWQLATVLGKLDAIQQEPNKRSEPIAPPDINSTILWHVEQRIRDELDINLKAQPTFSLFFIRYCRDRMTQAKMHREYGWSERTLKERKRILKQFLYQECSKLTLEAFFVDRRIFAAAERQIKEYRAKHLSRRAVGECQIDEHDGNGGEADG